MKYTLLVISLLFGFQIVAQDLDLQRKIEFVNSKIQQTEKGERLNWFDSLTKLTYRNPELEYDAILRKTIDFAIKLDSLNFATKKVADLIGFQNNFLGKPQEGLKLFNTYVEKLNKGTDFGAIGRMYLNAADSYYYTGDIDTSFEYYTITKDYAEKANDEYLYAYAVMYTGYNESEIGKFAEASQSLKEAAAIFVKLKDTTNILGAKNGLAVLYSRNAFYEEAEKERNESILMIGKTDRYTALTNLYFNAAEDHKKIGDFKQQLLNIKAAFLANSKTNNAFLAEPIILTQLVNAYCKNDSILQAEKYFEDLNALFVKDESEDLKEQIVKAKRVLSFTKGDYENAIKYSSEFLSLLQNKKTHLGDIVAAEQFLAEAYKASGDDINYKKHLLNHYTLKDSLSNIQNVKSLAYYQTLYETEKRDLKIENQNANISLLNLKNKSKTQLLIFGSLGFLLLFGGIIVYRSFVSAKKRGLAQQEFSQQLIAAQEQERTRIAKDLHDGVGQQITLIKMKAQNSDQTELSGLAHNALEEVRSISRDLYPVTLKKLGLTDSIEQLLLDLDEETDLFISIEIDDVNTSFNETESLNFYRFIQESVNNVLKHAKAKTLILNIVKQSDGIKVLIKDNGQGFEVNKMINQNSLGLKTMAERISMLKGNLSIKSKRDEGTSILVQIPV
ncbi:sensor histidine kinase [Psychroserpens burtonensis]|uniref:Sensor histidine kinase n=1 Tax=Psychroserpens burtonensis TaxID=49278 RepID=A0A5C7B6H0_9FLAO|nr:sensor histidine kinase [Psychroserpens burtonensis]TXE16145.1 sensor histidine kinase [Psychroserpens burtonensis]